MVVLLQSSVTVFGAQHNVVLAERLHPRSLIGGPETEADHRAYRTYARERTYQAGDGVPEEPRERER